MGLYEAVKDLWSQATDARSAGWAKAALAAVPAVEAAGDQFNEWRPLRFYTTLGGAGSSASPEFSVRFRGQEVAKVAVRAHPVLVVSREHSAANKAYFKIDIAPGKYPWTGPDARKFRRSFHLLVESGEPFRLHSEEHKYESLILSEMESSDGATKFAGTLRDIRHVGLTQHEYPFQVPVPISASKGKPKDSTGYLDIVARHGKGKPRLAIWELKAPGELQHVVPQVYVYSVVTALMLRGAGGSDWWRIFGYGSQLPKKLKIEAVVVVTEDQRAGVSKQAKNLLAGDSLDLAEEKTELALSAAFYDPRTLAMRIERLG